MALSVAAADWAERLKQSLEQAGSPSGWDQVGYVCVEKAFAKNLSVTGLTSLMKQLSETIVACLYFIIGGGFKYIHLIWGEPRVV